MENTEISLHLLKVYLFAKRTDGWFTNAEVTKAAGISDRTARAHTKTLVDKGVLERAEVFPGHRFRLRLINKAFAKKLDEAVGTFGSAAKM